MTARGRPFRVMLALAALIGLTLDRLAMDPVPSAVLRLTVDNRGTSHQGVREVVVSGGGAAGTTRSLGRVVAPSRQVEELITVPLRCAPGIAPSGALTVAVQLAGLVRLVSVEADGVLLPQPRVAERTGGTTMHIVVGAPAPGCRDGGLRPVVATGVQLRIDTGARLSDVYVPLGSAVAQWFMDAYVRACPSNPAGPPAVTVRLGG